MKLALTVAAVALVGAAPPGDKDTPNSPAAHDRGPLVADSQTFDDTPTPVINPDRPCDPKIVTADGRDDEAQFHREPAGPNPPPLFRAVDVSVGGCDMLLSMSGELRPLPRASERDGVDPDSVSVEQER